MPASGFEKLTVEDLAFLHLVTVAWFVFIALLVVNLQGLFLEYLYFFVKFSVDLNIKVDCDLSCNIDIEPIDPTEITKPLCICDRQYFPEDDVSGEDIQIF